MGRARGPGRGQSSPPRFSWKGRETNPTRKTERDEMARGGCSETLRVRKRPQVPKQNHSEKGQVQSHEL